MLSLHRQITKKLFYDQWPYKITCNIKGISLVRSHPVEDILNGKYCRKYSYNTLKFDKKKLDHFLSLSEKYINDSTIKKRLEYHKVSFYALTKEKHQEMLDVLKEYTTESFEPENEDELQKLLNNKHFIICKELPYKKFRYKVTFKEMPVNVRQNLIVWAEKYTNNELYITPSTRIHFKGEKNKFGTHYFLIKHKSMITFISLAAAGYIRRTDEYITQEEI